MQKQSFLRLVNMLQDDTQTRQRILRGYFATAPDSDPSPSALPPAARLALLDQWEEQSSAFAASRGYTPDMAQWRADLTQEDWTPPAGVSPDQITALLDATASALPHVPQSTATASALPHARQSKTAQTPLASGSITLRKFRIRPRPWVYNTYDWITQRLPLLKRYSLGAGSISAVPVISDSPHSPL